MFRFYAIPSPAPAPIRRPVNPFLSALFDDDDHDTLMFQHQPLYHRAAPSPSAHVPFFNLLGLPLRSCKRSRDDQRDDDENDEEHEQMNQCQCNHDCQDVPLRGHCAFRHTDSEDEEEDSQEQERVINHKKSLSAQQTRGPAPGPTPVAQAKVQPTEEKKEEQKRATKKPRTETTEDTTTAPSTAVNQPSQPLAVSLSSAPFGGLHVSEDETSLRLSLEAPNGGKLNAEKLKILVDHGLLTIKAESTSESKRQINGISYVSQSSTSFSRSVPLPRNVDEDNISAELGTDAQRLTVTVPKRAPSKQKTITVNIKTNKSTAPNAVLDEKSAPAPADLPSASPSSKLPAASPEVIPPAPVAVAVPSVAISGPIETNEDKSTEATSAPVNAPLSSATTEAAPVSAPAVPSLSNSSSGDAPSADSKADGWTLVDKQ